MDTWTRGHVFDAVNVNESKFYIRNSIYQFQFDFLPKFFRKKKKVEKNRATSFKEKIVHVHDCSRSEVMIHTRYTDAALAQNVDWEME